MPWLAHLTAVVSLAAIAAAPPFEPRRFDAAQEPAWVERIAIDLSSLNAPDGASDGIDRLLFDTQVQLGAGGCQHYFHSGHRVLSTAGIQNGSEIRVDFDPQYQKLTLHGVWRHRDGKRMAALQPDEVRVIQREPDLDRRIYDGMLTAIIFVKDVRAGDVIEYAYTLQGSNPVFRGRFTGAFNLAYRAPVKHLRIRIASPRENVLSLQAHGVDLPPHVSHRGDLTDRVWERRDVAGIDIEDDLPPGYEALPWLQVSEFSTWNAVATWAGSLYPPSELSAPMAEKVAQWRLQPSLEDRALAALRFVQDEVRYLGIELGSSSHQPHDPALVFAWRFGDCKDKSRLLVSLLRALGIDAVPALVNTSARKALDGRLPSPTQFDHVIVRARIDGRDYWMEPTRSFERGSLATLRPPPYQRALLVDPRATSLVGIPPPPPDEIEVTHAYRVSEFGKPMSFDVHGQISGARALFLRERLANAPQQELQKVFLEYYAHLEPQIRAGAPFEVEDDPARNSVSTLEHYQLPTVSDGERHGFLSDAIFEQLALPKRTLRSMPLNVRHPVRIRERFLIDLPGRPNIASESRDVHGEAMRLVRSVGVEKNRIVVQFDFETLRDSVQAEAAPRHLATVREMRALADFTLPLSVKDGSRSSDDSPAWLAFAAFSAVFVIGFAGWTVDGGLGRYWRGRRARRRKRELILDREPRLGESAAKPLRVSTTPEIRTHAENRRCDCGGKLTVTEAPDNHVMMGGHRIEVRNLSCPACGERRNLYFLVDD